MVSYISYMIVFLLEAEHDLLFTRFGRECLMVDDAHRIGVEKQGTPFNMSKTNVTSHIRDNIATQLRNEYI